MYLKQKVYFMESVRSSRRHGRQGGKFIFEIRQRLRGLCLLVKIAPLCLKLRFRKFEYGLGSARSVSIMKEVGANLRCLIMRGRQQAYKRTTLFKGA